MRTIPRNKGTAQEVGPLPGDVLSQEDFSKAEFDKSLLEFTKLADDPAAMHRELGRAHEFYRAHRETLPESWRLSISASLDMIATLANFQPALRTVIAARMRQNLEEHMRNEHGIS